MKSPNGLLIHLLSIIGMSAICTYSYGQEVYGKPEVWFLLLNGVEISDQWSVSNELHLRYDDDFKDKEQLLIRPFVNYKVSNGIYCLAHQLLTNVCPKGVRNLRGFAIGMDALDFFAMDVVKDVFEFDVQES